MFSSSVNNFKYFNYQRYFSDRMKVIKIDDVDKINFDNLKAEFKNRYAREPDCDVKALCTLKDSCFLNMLLEVWKKTTHEEAINKLSGSEVFNNYNKWKNE